MASETKQNEYELWQQLAPELNSTALKKLSDYIDVDTFLLFLDDNREMQRLCKISGYDEHVLDTIRDRAIRVLQAHEINNTIRDDKPLCKNKICNTRASVRGYCWYHGRMRVLEVRKDDSISVKHPPKPLYHTRCSHYVNSLRKQCSRTVPDGTKYCWQHEKYHLCSDIVAVYI